MLSRVRVLPSLAAALVAAAVLTPGDPAGAFAPRLDPTGAVQRRLVATAASGVKAPLREQIDVTGAVPPARAAAWDALQAATGGRWQATWDRATDVPSRVWGGSIPAPGASRSPDRAEAAARAFLEAHLALFAPGAAPGDLELVSNHDDGRIRTVVFAQRHGGLRVVGGQVGVRFLNDRLYVVSSQALPDVAIPAGPRAIIGDVAGRARDATAHELRLARARAVAAGDLVIVPLVGDDAVLGYRLAAPVEVEGGPGERWLVHADPSTGAPLVRRDLVHWADGTLVYDVPLRFPGGGRGDLPANRARVTVDGAAATTGDAGQVTWGREQTVPLVTSVAGDHVAVRDVAGDGEASANLTIAPGGTTRWTEAADPLRDAQLATYVHAQLAKDYARALVGDESIRGFLDAALRSVVNIDDACNAFFTFSGGEPSINFFRSSTMCENTGRLADVVYHEFGHGLHHHLAAEGGGIVDGGMGEGVADFFAVLITEDSGMGRGFFYDGKPLRELDPEDREAVWPRDIGHVHKTGLIYGGAMWDLWTAARAELGDEAGRALTERLFVATVRRGTDIPSTLIEALAADDDDGDLGNGTPHECLIRAAFARHGLRTVTATVDGPGRVASAATAPAEVVVALTGFAERCGSDEVAAVALSWEPRDGTVPAAGSAALAPVGGDVWTGALALPDPGHVVRYRIDVRFADGSEMRMPDNRSPADDAYELYRGDVVELYCTDFSTDPFEEGWVAGVDRGTDLWFWGAPTGGAGDPIAPYVGDAILGLGRDGPYEPNASYWLRSPVVDVGQYSDVRLQFRRWIGIEDGYYDQATIRANGEHVWRNYASSDYRLASLHTRDREWVFRDYPLSSRISDGRVQLTFALSSDGGLELGGWNLDDLCIVADPTAICGDGIQTRYEQCDDGPLNANAPDACRTNCRVKVCGDGIVDSSEACDDGNRDSGDGCSSICQLEDDGGGCCSSTSHPGGALAPLALVGLGLALGRRRRRAVRA